MRAFNLKRDWQIAQQRRLLRNGPSSHPADGAIQRRISRYFPPDRRTVSAMRQEARALQLVVERSQLKECSEVVGKIGPPAEQVAEALPLRRRRREFRLRARTLKMLPNILQNIRVVVPHVLLYSSTVIYTIFGAIVFHRLELPFEIEHLSKHSAAVVEAQDALLRILDTNGAIFDTYLLNSAHRGSVVNTTSIGDCCSITAHLQFASGVSEKLNETINQAIDNIIFHALNAYSEGIRAEELNHIRQLISFDANETRRNGVRGGVRSKWNFHSSLFFATTLLTSIGYGNLTPISPFGRLFCIAYAFLGIPLTLITIADVAKFLADLLMNAAAKWRRHIRDGFRQNRRMEVRENGVAASRDIPRGMAKASEEELSGDGDREAKDEAEDELYGKTATENGENRERYLDWLVKVSLLFAYMALTALAFSNVQENWDFLESLYFCLITLVTIGFGDFCPSSEDHYGWWILFIFAGLILSTLTVDLVGSSYIEKIHTLGRQLDFGAFLSVLGKGGTDSARLLHRLYAGAYIPSDVKLIPYIDQQMQYNYYHLHQQPQQQAQLAKHASKKPSLLLPSNAIGTGKIQRC